MDHHDRQKELEEQERWQELLKADPDYAKWLISLEKQREENGRIERAK